MVRAEGLEPPRLAPPEPKSGVSTNFTTPASGNPQDGGAARGEMPRERPPIRRTQPYDRERGALAQGGRADKRLGPSFEKIPAGRKPPGNGQQCQPELSRARRRRGQAADETLGDAVEWLSSPRSRASRIASCRGLNSILATCLVWSGRRNSPCRTDICELPAGRSRRDLHPDANAQLPPRRRDVFDPVTAPRTRRTLSMAGIHDMPDGKNRPRSVG